MPMTTKSKDFTSALYRVEKDMATHAVPHLRGKWQGLDVSKKREMRTWEILHYSIIVPMTHNAGVIDYLRNDIKPNLPWADEHFNERVGGFPLNPGKEWANWPWGQSADKFREGSGIFDHNYPERYWPKHANNIIPVNSLEEAVPLIGPLDATSVHYGIRFPYGDLNDVVNELANDPTTRQAVLPVFFPEDTGRTTGRKPCSMYYHFMLTEDKRLDITYPMRSCDMVRHLRDDIYLTVRLLLWMLDELKKKDNDFWSDVEPGLFVMNIANLHVFENDMTQLKAKYK